MWRNIFGQAIYQIGWLLAILFGSKAMFNLSYSKSTPFYALGTDEPQQYVDNVLNPDYTVYL